ncbi:MAG: germination protein YpeB [Clostridia bacterium]|jgi:germination protein YpeB|nr:germination protein YpeB [Clostridia bacterium]MDH7573267.1 germination protein YpeB [Clostridia bacterium]
MRNKWWRAAAVIGLCAALAGWALWERAGRADYVHAVEADNQLEFYNLISRVEQAEVAASKALVAASPRQQVLYLTQLWNEAADAQDSLAQLPVGELNLSATRKFLAQAGDYGLALARKLAGGEDLTVTERDQLSRITAQLGEFGRRLHLLETRLDQTNFRWSTLAVRPPGSFMAGRTARASTELEQLAELGNFDRQLQEVPSLTYDGPFSDHRLQVAPKGVTGPRLSRSSAQAKALAFAREAGLRDLRVASSRRTSGPIPAYSFALDSTRDGARITVDVTEKGGHIVQMLNDRRLAAARLNASQALRKAQAFLNRHGLKNMLPTYSLSEANAQTITFVATQQGVLLYPDQVKVKVALDNGDIVGWDALSYLTNHHSRRLPRPRLDESAARSRVSADLQVGRGRLCIIPTAGGQEKLAWEFSTQADGDRFLVYINALTGAEEQILKVVEQPGGQLTM